MKRPMMVYAELAQFGSWYLFIEQEQEIEDGQEPVRMQLSGPWDTIEALVQDAKGHCSNPIRVPLAFGPPHKIGGTG